MNALTNIGAVVRKEWQHYFGSPIAWVALAIWTFQFGRWFNLALDYFLEASMRGAQGQFGAPNLSLNEYVISPVLQNTAVVLLFIAPMITMRLFAEERRQGTMELLMTSPITNAQLVLGKFLAAAGLYAVMILTGMLNFASLWHYASAPPEWQPLLTGGLALLLMGSCFLSVGIFVSTLTRNQIVAGFISFTLFLGLWTLGWAEDPAGGAVSQIVAYLGVTSHMDDLLKGVLDLKDVVYYLSFIGFGLFLAQQSIESQRWRA